MRAPCVDITPRLVEEREHLPRERELRLGALGAAADARGAALVLDRHDRGRLRRLGRDDRRLDEQLDLRR